ncbi:hypothetical protein [Massilia rubra]|uniref:Uncharacterized protein n=1 Tax=Massilia rubra TaxID=2607910 RepID=A0ABX0LGZ0_9BURK|nr:hypothetical protein [Massilia rubra]NHZ33522.1 hypothetical protein [Massilia rubra]
MKVSNSIPLLLLIYVNGAIAGGGPSFESLRAQSHRDSRVPVGLAWEQKNAAEGGAKLTPVINECRKTAPEGKENSISLLVRLSKHGVPSKVLVSPETKFSECVRSGVSGFNFSDAPWTGYWLEINIGK